MWHSKYVVFFLNMEVVNEHTSMLSGCRWWKE